MYERSATVLEKNFNEILGFNRKINLKTIFKDYKEIIEELEKYQTILEEEEKVINGFDAVASEIRQIQKEQKNIYETNINLEEEKIQLFEGLDEEPEATEKKLKKIEEKIDKNNEKSKELRENFIKALTEFSDKQTERNKYSRARREEEKNHIQLIEKCNSDMDEIDPSILKSIKSFQNSDDEIYKKEIMEIMINNGKDERVPFDKNVIENAVNIRNEIAKKESECYIIIYDRMKRLLVEINNDEIKLEKYKKALRDMSVKLAFLKSQKMYIVSFLDNERMAAINGIKTHKQLMAENCKNLELDMQQFNSLYELILKEISGKATKKAYKELYDKEYLKNIEEKEKNFEEEINNIKIKTGAIINSNYWRIEEIKNVYDVFQNEVTEKFEKDLSEFKLEEAEQNEEIKDDIFKSEIPEEDVEYIDEYEDDDYEDEYDDYEEDDEQEEYDYNYDEKEKSDAENYDEDEDNYEDDDDEYEDDYEEDDYDDEYEDDYEEDEDDYEDDDDDNEYEDEYDEDDDSDEDEENDDSNIEKVKNDNQQSKNKKEKGGIFNKFFKDKRY